MGDDAGAGHTDVYDRLRFADTVERPAINGLSSTAFENTTSFAQPIGSMSAVCFIILPMSATAAMFMPALVEARFTLEQTSSVCVSAAGMELIRRRSLFVKALVRKRREAADEVHASLVRGAVERQGDGV